MTRLSLFTVIFFTLSSLQHAQDTALREYLSPEHPWILVAESHAFTDALCADPDGNLLFSDVKEGEGIYKLDLKTGKVSLLIPNLPGISGLKIGPDGTFFACHNREQRVISIHPQTHNVEVLLSGVKCNDLTITQKGFIYITETPTQSIHLITPDRQHRIVDQGSVTRPNGITLSTDENTLIVSDHGGQHVWTWQIAADGSLSAAAPFMTMQLAHGKESAQGDGATTDAGNRVFVTTEIGIQIFDSAGRLSGIIAKPEPNGKIVSCTFAGPKFDQLFVAAGARIYRRQLKTPGHFIPAH